MKIWVDADACPSVIKAILFRVSERAKLQLCLIANHAIRVPKSKLIKFVQVAPGFDVADNEIVKRLCPGDVVITADIPLAAEVIDKGGLAINPRGELYTDENIRARLNMRDFMDALRSSGINTGGPPPLSMKDQQAFANQLDRIVTKYLNLNKP